MNLTIEELTKYLLEHGFKFDYDDNGTEWIFNMYNDDIDLEIKVASQKKS